MDDKIKKIIDNIQCKLNNVTITFQNVIKNNNLNLRGICIKKNNENVAPVIYIDDFIESDMSIEEIADKIIDIYKRNETFEFNDIENLIQNFDVVKHSLFIRVVNYNKNKEMLNNIPHERFLNLALYPIISINNIFNASIKVTSQLIKYWNVSEHDIMDISKHNTLTYEKTKIINLKDLVMDLIGEDISELDDYMYVVTNEKNIYGSNRIIDISAFDKLADLFDNDLCVIPSSVHELIIIPMVEEFSWDNVNSMVKQVNIDEVSDEEILSDCAYKFIKNKHSFDFL